MKAGVSMLLAMLHAFFHSSAAYTVDVRVGKAPPHNMAATMPALTSVTIDVCLLKTGLPLDDALFVKLTSNLAAEAWQQNILRIGGSDQNNWSYNVSSRGRAVACACGRDATCTMTGAYWDEIAAFANKTGHRLVFGLSENISQSLELVDYVMARGDDVHAFTYTNEVVNPDIIQGYKALRALIDTTTNITAKPLLAGPDVALQRHASLEYALANKDTTIQTYLKWVEEFSLGVGADLDVLSWHTYDFHPYDFGLPDHAAFDPFNINASKFYNTSYLDFAGRLADNMTEIGERNVPSAKVWLTETDSVCHQGLYNATNAFGNSLWLVNRIGIVASRPIDLMGRQSLIGYNYSLLGNYPYEPIRPNPDYFTTILIQRLLGKAVFPIELRLSDQSKANRVRAFAMCHPKHVNHFTIAMINFDDGDIAEFRFDNVTSWDEYILTSPTKGPLSYTSREIELNGRILNVDSDGNLPSLEGIQGQDTLVVPPLSIAFAVIANNLCE